MSSDSGSTAQFRAFEDGYGMLFISKQFGAELVDRFAAYAASKAALNQALRVCILSETEEIGGRIEN